MSFVSLSDGWDKQTVTMEVIELPKYNVHVESVTFGDSEPVIMRVARTKQGHYIGNEETAKMLTGKYGIAPELASADHRVCSIGWSDTEKRWFGWSHRAIHGFSVGDRVKPGDCAYRPSTKNEWIRSMLMWHNEPEDPIKSYSWDDDTGTLTIVKTRTPDMAVKERFDPSELGSGEWVAKTPEDARRMAVEFAESVSSSETEPDWWDQDSMNPYCRGMTLGGEIMDYLERHSFEKRGSKYVFYHATTPEGIKAIRASGVIRKGSYLAMTEALAVSMVVLTRDVKRNQCITLELLLRPWEIHPGVHPTLREDYKI